MKSPVITILRIEMYTDMVLKISCQFLIGNVYQLITGMTFCVAGVCQFLIGNVYQKTLTEDEKKVFESVNSL